MSLDQTLTEIEPILRGTDGAFQFTHPSFQEILTAKQFADEINSGRLSVRDAYVNFWSYEEDADLWDLPKDREWRGLLPGWRPILIRIGNLIEEKKVNTLIQLMTESYSWYLKHKDKRNKIEENETYFYNPFWTDFDLAVDLSNCSKTFRDRMGRRIVRYLNRSIAPQEKEIHLKYLSNLHYYDREILKFLADRISSVQAAAAKAIGQIGSKDQELVRLLKTKNPNLLCMVIRAMGELRWYNPTILSFTRHENEWVRAEVADALGNMHVYNPCLVEMLGDEKARWELHYSAAKSLGKIVKYDPKMKDLLFPKIIHLLDNNTPAIRINGIRALCELGCPEELIDLLRDSDHNVAQVAEESLGEMGHVDQRIIEGLTDINPKIKVSSLHILGNCRYYHSMMDNLLTDDNAEVRCAAVWTLGIRLSRYNPKMFNLIMDPDKRVSGMVESSFGYTRHFDNRLTDLLSDNRPYIRASAASILGRLRKFDERLVGLLEDKDVEVMGAGIYALGRCGYYDPRIPECLEHDNDEIKRIATRAMKNLNTFDSRILEIARSEYNICLDAYEILKHFGIWKPMLDKLEEVGNPLHLAIALEQIPNIDIIKEIRRRNIDSSFYGYRIIFEVHQLIKPQGYNPPVKKLAA